METQSFQSRFEEVLSAGETVIRHLSVGSIRPSTIVDIIRVMIEAQLSNQMSEATNVALASALVHFQELHPDHTDKKFALLKYLGEQVINLASSLDESSENDSAFYKAHLAKQGSPFYALTKGVIECQHPQWVSDLKESIRTVRKEKIETLVQYIFSYFFGSFLVFANPYVEGNFLHAITPIYGQIFCLRQTSGFWFFLSLILALMTWATLLSTLDLAIHLAFKTKRPLLNDVYSKL